MGNIMNQHARSRQTETEITGKKIDHICIRIEGLRNIRTNLVKEI